MAHPLLTISTSQVECNGRNGLPSQVEPMQAPPTCPWEHSYQSADGVLPPSLIDSDAVIWSTGWTTDANV